MSTESPRQSVRMARERLEATRAEVSEALALLHVDRRGTRDHRERTGFPRSAIMRAAATREGRFAIAAAALGILAVRPGLIPVVWRIGRVMPVLPIVRSLLNRYLVRRNAAYQ